MEEMEKRSRRRTRDLVTQAASQGLSQNEIGCARISMMARSTNAPCKGRIQMRKTNPLHFFTFGLQRTAGPYSWVINGPDDPEIRLPLFPQKRTQVGHRAMSGSCQQATSFDHLVGAGDEGSRKIEAEGFCRLQVNHQIIFGRSLDRKIGRLLTLENAIDITGRAPKLVDAIGPVENQPAAVDIVSVAIHGRKSVLGSQFNDEIAMRRHSGARRYDQASIP